MRITVVGQGYAGLTASVGLAAAGHTVIGIERDVGRLRLLESGASPLYEPGLQDVLTQVVSEERLTFASTMAEVPPPIDAVVIAVGSPPLPTGGADLTDAGEALRDAFATLPAEAMVVMGSTIPPGTSQRWLQCFEGRARFRDRYVYSPEFLSQGSALQDWRHPHRVVFGLWNRGLLAVLKELYRGIDAPWLVTEPIDAEMVKYASNACLATKISFVNEIGNFCEQVGADIDRVVEGLRLDPRLGDSFWRPGIGYGDSCLPKDVAALIHQSTALACPMPLLRAVQAVNESQHLRPLQILHERLRAEPGARPVVSVLGLSYEPHTDDMRAAPSLGLVAELVQLVGDVRVWDPLLPPAVIETLFPSTTRCKTIEQAVDGSGVVIVLTEFPEVRDADWKAIADRVVHPALVIDGKNCLDVSRVTGAGLGYRGMGRPPGSESLASP